MENPNFISPVRKILQNQRKSWLPATFLVTSALAFSIIGTKLTVAQDTPARPSPSPSGVSFNKAIVAAGGSDASQPGFTLWHDYGPFALYKVSDAARASLAASTSGQVQMDPLMDRLQFDRHPVDTQSGRTALPPLLTANEETGGALHVIQFVGPIKDEWLDAIAATGSRPIQYIATNGYLVWTDGAGRSQLDTLANAREVVQYSAPYQPAFKLGASIERRILAGGDAEEVVPVVIQIYNHPGKQASQHLIAKLTVERLSDWSPVLAFENVIVRVRAADLLTIAQLPDVVWVGERLPREMHDEVQAQIVAGHLDGAQAGPSGPGYKTWLDSLGFSQNPADYPIVSVADDGVGNGSTANGAGDVTLTRLGDGTTSRVAFARNCTIDASADGGAGHGHINTSIVSGYDTRPGTPYQFPSTYQRGQGISPYGRTGNTKVFANDGSWDISACGNNEAGVIKSEQDSGARISSNSWGADSGTYDESSQAYDAGVRDADPSEAGTQSMVFVFSAGNSGSSAGTIGSPGNGKNMITVGASENQRQIDENGNWTDGCDTDPTGADNAMDVIDFSSRGPAPGGRVKPEVIAPGTHIQGTASTSTAYDGTGVCDRFRPTGQTLFAASSGTSHSAPAVAGVASLYYRWLQTQYSLTTPSPAVVKAYMMSHPTYLTGVSANDTLPSNSQGYGMPDMKTAFDNTSRTLLDQTRTFGSTGQTWTWNGSVANTAKPVRIALAYTDAPGALGTSPQVNNLNLTVVVNGVTYLGNRFTGQWSTTGGTADSANNYEAIYLPAGTKGPVTITVTAANIAGDGVPGNADPTDQDFALVCYNCTQQVDFSLTGTPSTRAVCAPSSASYTINVGSILGFANRVTLGATGQPSGTTATFNPNPVTPAGTSAFAIGNTGAATPGAYTLHVSGAATGGISKSIDLGLSLFNAAPGAATLTAPANGASNVSATPTFAWTPSARAATYAIEVATDAGFSTIVASATGLTSPTWTPGTTLNTGIPYFWRVRSGNACGTGGDSAVFQFSTLAAPGDCGPGTTANVLYQTGFEDGAGAWTSSGTGNTWALATTNPHSGVQHFHANDPAAVSDQRLAAPVVTLPTGQNPLTMKFWHAPNLEKSSSVCFDGGILEMTTDGGTTWTQVPAASLLVGPYTLPVSADFENPLAGLKAWCGTSSTYINTIVDISAYAGQTVQFRARLGSDDSEGRPGWDLDDVRVQSCRPTTPPTISVNPTTLGSTQPVGSLTNKTLDIGNAGEVSLAWTITEKNAVVSKAEATAPNARRVPKRTGTSAPRALFNPAAAMIGEGFPVVGDGDDIHLGDADPSWPTNWTWAQSVFNLTPLLPKGAVRLGFRYVGSDGAEVLLDEILLDGNTQPVICSSPSEVPWLGVSPTTGNTSPGQHSSVTVSFDSRALAVGSYQANLCVASNDPVKPVVAVPVTLEVNGSSNCQATAMTIGPEVFGTGIQSRASQQSINTQGAVVVQSGADLTFRAPVVRLQPGVRVAAGAVFHGRGEAVTCPAAASAKPASSTTPSQPDLAAQRSPGGPQPIARLDQLPAWVQAVLVAQGIDLAAASHGLLDPAGFWLLFETAQALDSADRNEASDLYRLDLLAERLSLLSRTPAGQAGNGPSGYSATDASGEWVVFQSEADDLVANDDNGVTDIYLHQVSLGLTRRLTVTAEAAAHPALDAAGVDLWFDRRGEDGQRQIVIGGLSDSTAPVAIDQRVGANVSNHHPAISPDGRYLAYLEETTTADSRRCQVFLYDRDTGRFQHQSCPAVLAAAPEDAWPHFSADGSSLEWDLPGADQPANLSNLLWVQPMMKRQ